MPLNNLVRAASKVVPWATRAASRVVHLNSALSSANGRPRDSSLRRSFPSFLHHYSTETSPDETLLHTLHYEIDCTSHSFESEKSEVPQGFPFKIEDRVGTQTVTLTREYQGETIIVEVHMPDLVTGKYEGNEDRNQSTTPLIVKTSKKDGPYLEFGCTAYPDEITIDSLSVRDPDLSEDQIGYEGPDFADLDEKLQRVMLRYLEIRGIELSMTDYLLGYMIEKDTREYVEWLKKMSKFVQD